MRVIHAVGVALAAITIWMACETVIPEPAPAEVKVVDEGGEEKIFIVDATGKEWDVTHAVNKYLMPAQRFQHGLGPEAIPPVFEPTMLHAGDAGYPPSSETFIVIGAAIDGETRAYSIADLTRREIVDEYFNNTPVAVGW